MSICKRAIIVIGGILLAILVAAHVCMIIWYAPDWRSIAGYGLPHGSLAAVVSAFFIYVTSVPFVLFVLVIALAEIYALRSVVFHVACGLALTLLIRYDLGSMIGQDKPYELYARGGLILTATGVTLGLVYWAIAGRSAGSWRGRPVAQQPTG